MGETNLSRSEQNLLKLLEERDRIADQVQLCDKAISFWEHRMESLFDEMEKNESESWSPEYEDKNEHYLKEKHVPFLG